VKAAGSVARRDPTLQLRTTHEASRGIDPFSRKQGKALAEGPAAPSMMGASTTAEEYRDMARKTPSGPREAVKTRRNKSLARRDDRGRFTEMTDLGRSLSHDRRQHARHPKPRSQGDKGD